MEIGAATDGGYGGAATSNEETGCQPSLNSLALARKAIPRIYISPDDTKEWRHAVCKGVLLENNTQAKSISLSTPSVYLSINSNYKMCGEKFWVDAKLHKNCFLVLPKACDIAGGDEERCWSWITKEEKCFPMAVDIPVPKSKELSWLFIQGRFETRALSPETKYEVAFVVKVKLNIIDSINLAGELLLPKRLKKCFLWNGRIQLKEGWNNVPAGQFKMDPKTVGTIHFKLEKTFNLKEGDLILGGVLIHPKD